MNTEAMTDDLHERYLPDSAPCPACGVEPVWDEDKFKIYHKHDCLFHWRNVRDDNRKIREQNEEKQAWAERSAKVDRIRAEIDYWIHRWKPSDVFVTIVSIAFVIFLFLFFTGIIDLE